MLFFCHLGTSLIFRLDAGQLSITSTPGPTLFQNSLGLLGTYDNNQTNDFTLPDGKILSTESEPDVVYSVFGESCIVIGHNYFDLLIISLVYEFQC